MARVSIKNAKYYVYGVNPRTKKVDKASFHISKDGAKAKAKELTKKHYKDVEVVSLPSMKKVK